MSADNLISVYETNEGDFLVSMEFASEFWEVEFSYWELEETAKNHRNLNMYAEIGQYGLFKTFDEAVRSAHRCEQKETIVEYGLSILLKEDRLARARLMREYREVTGDGTLEQEEVLIERLALARRAAIT